MIDILQVVFIVVVSVLSTLLVVIGIEIYKMLKQTQQTMDRVNTILDDVEVITHNIAKPVEHASHLIQGIKQGAHVVSMVHHLVDKISPNQPKQT